MNDKITIFLMTNDGEFKFTKIEPYYEDIINALGVHFNDYIDEERVKIDGLQYTIYSKANNKEITSHVTAINQNETFFMLDSFILIRENKNKTFFNMSTANIDSIKSRLVVTNEAKVRLWCQEYIKNKIILKFD